MTGLFRTMVCFSKIVLYGQMVIGLQQFHLKGLLGKSSKTSLIHLFWHSFLLQASEQRGFSSRLFRLWRHGCQSHSCHSQQYMGGLWQEWAPSIQRGQFEVHSDGLHGMRTKIWFSLWPAWTLFFSEAFATGLSNYGPLTICGLPRILEVEVHRSSIVAHCSGRLYPDLKCSGITGRDPVICFLQSSLKLQHDHVLYNLPYKRNIGDKVKDCSGARVEGCWGLSQEIPIWESPLLASLSFLFQNPGGPCGNHQSC